MAFGLGGLALALLLGCAGHAVAFELAPYLDASQDDQPAGEVGLTSEGSVFSLKAGLELEAEDGHTKALPRLRTGFAISDSLDVQAKMTLSDWNNGVDFDDAKFDTRLRLESPFPFVEQLQAGVGGGANGASQVTLIDFRSPISSLDRVRGEIRRTTNGSSRYSINLGFSDKSSGPDSEARFDVRGQARLEKVARPHGPEPVVLAVETVVSGFLPPDPRGPVSRWAPAATDKLVLRFERESDTRDTYQASLKYRQSWRIRKLTEIDLVVQLRNVADRMSSSVDITWSSRF